MSERQTDYRGSAELNLDMVHNGTVRGTAGAQVVATTAQAYATLALVEAQQKANEIAERAVEQQRIASLITLAGWVVDAGKDDVRHDLNLLAVGQADAVWEALGLS